eukprot:COSAG01_NODE_96_length_26789_cov_36.697089_32_plen_62_part_00
MVDAIFQQRCLKFQLGFRSQSKCICWCGRWWRQIRGSVWVSTVLVALVPPLERVIYVDIVD